MDVEGVGTAEQASTSGKERDQNEKLDCYIILHSVGKRHNVGTIARCATAFGVKEVLV
jgi:tRNA G18 (ribose-2'-O)-methylase SpoU